VSGAYTAPVVAAGPDDDPPWLATVYVPGPSLAEAVHTAGPVLALRASTDRQAWRASTDGSVTSGIAAARGIVYAGGNDYVVRALRAIDGGPVWQFTASGRWRPRSPWRAGQCTSAATISASTPCTDQGPALPGPCYTARVRGAACTSG
jgi:hypothetical protein